ncbi:hypothetical protein BpHYR1_004635, partial [Brachionus plicatilis]
MEFFVIQDAILVVLMFNLLCILVPRTTWNFLFTDYTFLDSTTTPLKDSCHDQVKLGEQKANNSATPRGFY